MQLGAYMQQHIFAPLHLTNILYHIDRHPPHAARLAPTFQRTPSGALAAIPDPSKPTTDDFGGGGLVASAPDLLAIYAALLQRDPRILGARMLGEIAAPQLPTRAGLESIENVDPGALCGIPRGAPITYGLGGLVNLEDVKGGRRTGSIAWSGMRNYYFVSATFLGM